MPYQENHAIDAWFKYRIRSEVPENGNYRKERGVIGKILHQLCERKGVKIIAAEACPDHIHLFVKIPPQYAVSSFMEYLKGKSSTMLHAQFDKLKYKFRNRQFWCRGYYVDKVGKNESRIARKPGRNRGLPPRPQ